MAEWVIGVFGTRDYQASNIHKYIPRTLILEFEISFLDWGARMGIGCTCSIDI
jgi:hypothetical protein